MITLLVTILFMGVLMLALLVDLIILIPIALVVALVQALWNMWQTRRAKKKILALIEETQREEDTDVRG